MQSYIKLFFSFREETSALTDAEIGRLVRQMLAYGEFGDTDGAMSGNERFLFPVYRAQIARDSDRYAAIVETRAECGRAGARAKAAKRITSSGRLSAKRRRSSMLPGDIA